MTYTIGSLFSGYGGLDAGVQLALGPARTAWVSDIDAGASAILARRFPDAPNLGDITTVDWSQVEPVDVITGGSPCQDVSHAGKRAGMKAGTRSGLWASMVDAIDIIRPRLVVWENVRGVLSAEADSTLEPCSGCVGDGDDGPVLRALGRVLGDLADVGYMGGWCGLRAADVGACHGRFRVFVVAWSATDTDRLGHQRARAARHGRPGPTDSSSGPLTLLPTPAVNDMGSGKTLDAWDAWTAAMQTKHGNGNGHGASLSIEALRLLPTPTTQPETGNGHARDLRTELLPTPRATRGGSGTETMYGLGAERSDEHRTQAQVQLMPTPRATDGTKGGPNQRGSSGDLMLPSAVQSFGKYAAAITRHEHAFGRPAPAPTRPDGKAGAHRLSPEFVEWMQGLPAGWVTDPAIWDGWKPSAARNAQLAALGNGVVPAQASEAITWVLAAITGTTA